MNDGKRDLSAKFRAFLPKLKALDLGPIAYKLMHPETGKGLDSRTSQPRFDSLYYVSGFSLSLSECADRPESGN
jgi:hypothetical protein